MIKAISKPFVFFFIASVVSSLGRRKEEHCSSNIDCKSQNCVPVCETSFKKCIEPQQFLERHGMESPKCISDEFTTKLLSLHPRRKLGETCVNNGNCMSRNCIRECGKFNEVRRCIEPFSFYLEQKLELPQCVDEKKSTELIESEKTISDLQKDQSNEKKYDTGEDPLAELRKLDEKLRELENIGVLPSTEAIENNDYSILASIMYYMNYPFHKFASFLLDNY